MAKSVTAKQVMDLVKQQGYVCAISGRALTPETASLDHIVPLGRGGEHALRNICIIDHQVNLAKGTMTMEEFIAMCREVIAYQDRGRELALAAHQASPSVPEAQGMLPGIEPPAVPSR